ncbi:MAG: hypothetical protein O2809_00805 [Proteobacteria bacterium]|nr:hypothetical protein [Pseudomonadota bacterium]
MANNNKKNLFETIKSGLSGLNKPKVKNVSPKGQAKSPAFKVGIIAVAVIGVLSIALSGNKKESNSMLPQTSQAKSDAQAFSQTGSGDAKENWRLQEHNNIQDMKSQLSSLEDQIKKMSESTASQEAQYKADKAKQAQLQAEQSAQVEQLKKENELLKLKSKESKTTKTSNSSDALANAQVGNVGYGQTYATSLDVQYAPSKHKADTVPQALKKNPIAGYLPLSFFRGYLLYGFDAQTGSFAQKQEQPVLIQATTNAVSPNGHVYDGIKGCYITGKALGNLSSMRVQVKLISMECLNSDGRWMVSSGIKGNLVDSDGYLGLRGKYVSHQGSKLAMAFWASVFQSAGNVFQASQGTTFLNPMSGTTSMPLVVTNPSAAGMTALGGGISGGAGMLSQFYLEQAKQMSPVLRVAGGRTVEINLTQGVVLKWQDRASPMIPDDTQSTTARFNNGGGAEPEHIYDPIPKDQRKTPQLISSYDDGSNPSNMTNDQMSAKVDQYMNAANNTNAYVNQIKKQHQQ